jgi:tetratricopeptide (TPR) repeat protein
MSALQGQGSRLTRLLGYLETDPANLTLLADAAQAALDEGAPGETRRLLGLYAQQAPLSPPLRNLDGLAALALEDFTAARDAFEALLDEAPQDLAINFNLAWSRAMLKDFAGADALISTAVIAAIPRAAALKVQAIHGHAQPEEALACGLGLAELYPQNRELMAAIAVAALDAEDIALTEAFALRAGDNPEGLAALGLVRLGEDQADDALVLFDRALQARAQEPRALLGKGLALLLKGEAPAAAALLDCSAGLFATHVGTWVAAGWAYLVAADRDAARRCFETALALDDRFAETQGALAVLDLLDDLAGRARRRATIAQRLDPDSLGGALARSLILAREGKAEESQAAIEAALNTPVAPGARTVAQALVDLGFTRRKGPAGS